jgi:hypothetical protein
MPLLAKIEIDPKNSVVILSEAKDLLFPYTSGHARYREMARELKVTQHP